MSGARLKMEERQGRGFSSIAAHLQSPSHSTVVIILKPFANSDFVKKKTMTVKQSSDTIFFSRDGFFHHDTQTLANGLEKETQPRG